MTILHAYYPPYCCYYFYKGPHIYKVSKLLGEGYTRWNSFEHIEAMIPSYTFFRISEKAAILRGIL